MQESQGPFMAILLSYINAESFHLMVFVLYLEIVIVEESARFWDLFGSNFHDAFARDPWAKYQLYQIIVQGLVLVLTFIFMPLGISGMFWRFFEWTKRMIEKMLFHNKAKAWGKGGDGPLILAK